MADLGPHFVMYPHVVAKLLGKDLTADEMIEAVATALVEADVISRQVEFYRREASVFGKGEVKEVLRLSYFWVTIA